MYYYGARYYDAGVGRFISIDPFGLISPEKILKNPQSFNLYAYTKNNPLKYVDPTGLWPTTWGEFKEDLWIGTKDAFWTICPVFNDYRDYSEMKTGKDFITDENLSTGELAITAASMYIPFMSGKEIRVPLQAAEMTEESVEKVIEKTAGKIDNIINKVDNKITEGMNIFRMWGNKSHLDGHSWTPRNPLTTPDFINRAGLPDENSGEFITEGILKNTKGVSSGLASPYYGREGLRVGGLQEMLIPNPLKQIEIINIKYKEVTNFIHKIGL